jgi:hypothetical protein
MEAIHDSPEQWLENVGSEYLAKIEAKEPQFLVEIEISEERLQDIFARLSRAPPTRWSVEKRICLALAAVHSAARADEGEDSLRQVCLTGLAYCNSRLRYSRNFRSISGRLQTLASKVLRLRLLSRR